MNTPDQNRDYLIELLYKDINKLKLENASQQAQSERLTDILKGRARHIDQLNKVSGEETIQLFKHSDLVIRLNILAENIDKGNVPTKSITKYIRNLIK